ncbi:MAG TPA: hypothetical protein VG013_26720 [Gemmataceae bacterium]|nr:hypothetical protein [Gemmataceae bacterium]
MPRPLVGEAERGLFQVAVGVALLVVLQVVDLRVAQTGLLTDGPVVV